MLLMSKHGLHRIPVVQSPGGDIVNIITQSAVVEQLAKNLGEFPEIAQATLEDLGLASHGTVYSARADDSLMSALATLTNYNLSAVPVLGLGNVLVGNVSARDIRSLILDSSLFALLKQPVR